MAILRRDCPHCPVAQVAFEIKWAEPTRKRAGESYCIATCGACGAPICFRAIYGHPNDATPMQYQGDIEPVFTVRETWPSRRASSAPPHTPKPVAGRFVQGENAYQRGDWNAAVAMYRSTLDIATKGMAGVPPDQQFFPRLKWLAANQRITPEMEIWGHRVRLEGNDALHDPEEFTEEDATPLQLFTEMFLRYVFELPGEVQAFRGEAPDAANSEASADPPAHS